MSITAEDTLDEAVEKLHGQITTFEDSADRVTGALFIYQEANGTMSGFVKGKINVHAAIGIMISNAKDFALQSVGGVEKH